MRTRINHTLETDMPELLGVSVVIETTLGSPSVESHPRQRLTQSAEKKHIPGKVHFSLGLSWCAFGFLIPQNGSQKLFQNSSLAKMQFQAAPGLPLGHPSWRASFCFRMQFLSKEF